MVDQAYKKSQLVKGIQRVAPEEKDTTEQYIASRRNSQAQSQKYLNFHNNTTTRKRNQEDERGKTKKLFKQEIRKSYQSIEEDSEQQVARKLFSQRKSQLLQFTSVNSKYDPKSDQRDLTEDQNSIKSEDPIGSIISSNIKADIIKQKQKHMQKHNNNLNNHQAISQELNRKNPQASKSNKYVGASAIIIHDNVINNTNINTSAKNADKNQNQSIRSSKSQQMIQAAFRSGKFSNQEDQKSKNEESGSNYTKYKYQEYHQPETKVFSPLVKQNQQVNQLKSEIKEKPMKSKERLRFDYPLSRDETPNQRINNSNQHIKKHLQISQVQSPTSVIDKYQHPQSARDGLMSKHQSKPSKDFPKKDTCDDLSQTRKTNRNCDLEETQNHNSSKKIFSMIVNEKLLHSTNQNANKEETIRLSTLPFGKQISSRFGSLFKLQKKNLLDEDVTAIDENNLNNSVNSLKKKLDRSNQESSFDIKSEEESNQDAFSLQQQETLLQSRHKSNQRQASRSKSPKRDMSKQAQSRQDDKRQSAFKLKPQIQYDLQRSKMKSQRSQSPINEALFQKKKHLLSYDENSLERELIEKLNEESSIHVDVQMHKQGKQSHNKQRGHTIVRESHHDRPRQGQQSRRKNKSQLRQKPYISDEDDSRSYSNSEDEESNEYHHNRRSTMQHENPKRQSRPGKPKSSRHMKRQSFKKSKRDQKKINQMPLQMPQMNMMMPPQYNMFGFQIPAMPTQAQMMNFPNMMQYPNSQIPFLMQQQQQQQQQQQYYNMLYGQIQQQMQQQQSMYQQPQTQTTCQDEQKQPTPTKNMNSEEKPKKNINGNERDTSNSMRNHNYCDAFIINLNPPIIMKNQSTFNQSNIMINSNEPIQFPFNLNIQNSTTNQSFQPHNNISNNPSNIETQNKSNFLGQSVSQNKAGQDFIPHQSISQNDSIFLKLNKLQNNFSNQTLESIDQDFKFGQIQNLQNMSKQISEEPGSSNKIQHQRLGSPQSNMSRLDAQSTNNTGDYLSSMAPSQQAILGLQNRRSTNIQSQIKEVNQLYLNKLKDKYQKVNLNDETSLTASVHIANQDRNDRSNEFLLSPRMISRNQAGLTQNNSTPIKDKIQEHHKIQGSSQISQADRNSILLPQKLGSVFKDKRLSSVEPSEIKKLQFPQYYDTNQDTLQQDTLQSNYQMERHRSPQPKDFKMFQHENLRQDDIQLKLRVLNQKLSQSRQTSIQSKPIKEAAVDLESNYDENYSHIEQKLQQLKDKKIRTDNNNNFDRSIDSRQSQSQLLAERISNDQSKQKSRQQNNHQLITQANRPQQTSINSSLVQTKHIKINVEKNEDFNKNRDDVDSSSKLGLILIETSPKSSLSQNKKFNKFQNQIKSPKRLTRDQPFVNIKSENNCSESMRSSVITTEQERQSSHAYYEKNINMNRKQLNNSVQQQNIRKNSSRVAVNNISNISSGSKHHLDFNSKIMTTYQEEMKTSNISSGTNLGNPVFNTTTGKNRQSLASSNNSGIKLLQMTKSIDRRDERDLIVEIFDKPKHKNQAQSVDTRDKNKSSRDNTNLSDALSLAEMFKQKMGNKAAQLNLDRRFNQSQQQNPQMPTIQEKEKESKHEKERTKKELLDLRRKMMKSNVKEKKDNFNPETSKDPSQRSKEMPYELMQRLSKGMKIQLDSKEMVKLSHKNYDNLPEVKKKKEEERKKEDYKQRQQIVKKYAEELDKKRKQIHLKKQASSNNEDF